MTRVLLASGNPHKLDEVRPVLQPLGIEVDGLDALPDVHPEPDENGSTFEENARIKAVEYARMTGRICLADDSGLEVDALDGAPGVHSARWSGIEGSREERDRANNEKLVALMHGIPEEDRSARFVCAMCLATPDGEVLAESRGVFEGAIVDEPRGSNGFGYDPYLQVSGDVRTSAELAPEEKNARSHRGAASRAMAELIKDRIGDLLDHPA
ncbi:MAG: RdgB/HAM1 family non-canonical purine NTP pyrophosphatase [Phycisphaerales bacterium]|nr:RdgB/HAM1 family non-canonical purine NTP pyrophosphatase [Phycisphaerales bacterium]